MVLRGAQVDHVRREQHILAQTIMSEVERMRENRDDLFDNSVNHLIKEQARILDPTFSPTQDDILAFRYPTTDISVVTYPVPDNPNVKLRFVDVGGQRPERVKWNQIGSGVDFVIYVSALDDYDKTLMEDASKNRLKESLMLYKVRRENTRNAPARGAKGVCARACVCYTRTGIVCIRWSNVFRNRCGVVERNRVESNSIESSPQQHLVRLCVPWCFLRCLCHGQPLVRRHN